MKINRTAIVITCLMVGFGAGAAIPWDVLWQKPVYLIAEIKIEDQVTYAEYADKVPAIVKKYGGEYLVRGGKVSSMAGGWDPQRIIVIKFASKEHLKKCFSSKEYLAIMPLRESSTMSRAAIAEGYHEGRN